MAKLDLRLAFDVFQLYPNAGSGKSPVGSAAVPAPQIYSKYLVRRKCFLVVVVVVAWRAVPSKWGRTVGARQQRTTFNFFGCFLLRIAAFRFFLCKISEVGDGGLRAGRCLRGGCFLFYGERELMTWKTSSRGGWFGFIAEVSIYFYAFFCFLSL